MLHRVQNNIEKHTVIAFARATIDADLAIDAACKGQRNEAINRLRDSYYLYLHRGFRPLARLSG